MAKPVLRVFLKLTADERLILLREVTILGTEHRFEWVGTGDPVNGADIVLISRQSVRGFDEHRDLWEAHLAGVTVRDYREFISDLQRRVSLEPIDFWRFLISSPRPSLRNRIYEKTKLAIEPLLALVLLILLCPILLLISLAIRIASPGPVFFRQTRSGYLGKPFSLIKFRSMNLNAEESGPQWSSAEDPRVHSLGRFLRQSRLDELPQLVNVVLGEMSFVGPRPERPEFYEKLRSEIPLFELRTGIRPGITGWAQVMGGYAASSDESRRKLEYDLYYIRHRSFALDFSILFKTLGVVARFSTEASPERRAVN